MSLFDQRILVRHPSSVETDKWGQEKPVWQESTINGWYEVRTSSRGVSAGDLDAVNQISSGYWLYLEGNQHFTDQSEAFIDGDWHTVDGRAETQPGGHLVGSYRPIALKRTTG